MNIVHLTSVHPRYDTRVFLKECRSLAAAGHDVFLVVADGMGNEELDNVHIVDVGKLNGRINRMFRTVDRVRHAAISIRADVYHLHDPELLRIAGGLRCVGDNARVVFDAHEDVPRQILSKQWIPSPLRGVTSWAAELVENRIARGLSGVVTATPHIAQRFRRINAHTVDINNYPMPAELSRSAEVYARKRQVCYIGGITRARGIESVIRALPLVPDVTLTLCGNFQECEFEMEMRALPGWRQVDYRGHVDRSVVREVLGESVAGLVTLLPTPAYLDALPVKMFEYMAAELPVIASDFPLWRKIVHDADAGICVDPKSPEEIAEAIVRLINDQAEVNRMGLSGRKAVLEKYNWPQEARKLVDFYKSIE